MGARSTGGGLGADARRAAFLSQVRDLPGRGEEGAEQGGVREARGEAGGQVRGERRAAGPLHPGGPRPRDGLRLGRPRQPLVVLLQMRHEAPLKRWILAPPPPRGWTAKTGFAGPTHFNALAHSVARGIGCSTSCAAIPRHASGETEVEQLRGPTPDPPRWRGCDAGTAPRCTGGSRGTRKLHRQPEKKRNE